MWPRIFANLKVIIRQLDFMCVYILCRNYYSDRTKCLHIWDIIFTRIFDVDFPDSAKKSYIRRYYNWPNQVNLSTVCTKLCLLTRLSKQNNKQSRKIKHRTIHAAITWIKTKLELNYCLRAKSSWVTINNCVK